MYTFDDSCLPRRHVQSFSRGCPRTRSMIREWPRGHVRSYSRGCHCTRSTTLEWPRGHVRSFSRGCHCTRSMVLKRPHGHVSSFSRCCSIHGSARSTILELSTSMSHLRLLGCAGALYIVQGVHHLGWLFVQIYLTRGDVYVFCPDLHVLQCWVLL